MKAPFKTFALVIATLGIACAAAAPAGAGPLPYAGGIVQADGTILSGGLFTVAHPTTGQYTVTYDSATFGGVPAMAVSAFGSNNNKIAVAVVYSETKSNGKIVFTILASRTAGKYTPYDSGFQFTIVST